MQRASCRRRSLGTGGAAHPSTRLQGWAGGQTPTVPHPPASPRACQAALRIKGGFGVFRAAASGLPPAPFVSKAAEPPGSHWGFITTTAGTAPAACSPRQFQLLSPPGSLHPHLTTPPPGGLKPEGFLWKAGCARRPGTAGVPTGGTARHPVGPCHPGGCPQEGRWLDPRIPAATVFKVSQPCLLAESWNLQLQLC